MTDLSHAAALRSAGVKVDVYVNFWRNHTSDNPIIGYTDLKPGGAHAAAEARTCSGSVIWDKEYGGGYEADARSGAALGHAEVRVGYTLREWAGYYDALFTDDSDGMGGIPLPCNYGHSTYMNAINTVDTALKVPLLLSPFGGSPDPPSEVTLMNPANVLGGMCEICYSGHNYHTGQDVPQIGNKWIADENAEIVTVAHHKIYWVYARSDNPAQDEIALRKYLYASFLLTYDVHYAMLWVNFETAHGFPVMPETGVVPMNPLTTATSVTGYQKSGGAYMREFGACYFRGVNHGRCSVVVNPTSSTVPVPTTAYSHSLLLSGSGVLDGGTVSFSGGRVTSLASGNGAILFP